MKNCPKCHHPLPPPDRSDFARMHTRDRERMLEDIYVRKDRMSNVQPVRCPPLAHFAIDVASGALVVERPQS